MIDEETRQPIDGHEKARGYEIGKGQFLLVEDEELEAIEIESTHMIDIDSFVPRTEIDRRFFEQQGQTDHAKSLRIPHLPHHRNRPPASRSPAFRRGDAVPHTGKSYRRDRLHAWGPPSSATASTGSMGPAGTMVPRF